MNNAMRMWLVSALACCALTFAVSPMALAQTVTGAITGTVTDASGAILAGVQVTALDQDTGVNTSTTTNSSGSYRIDFLPIGHYQVTVHANGFSTATLPPFTLEVLQTAKFNVKMTVGSSVQTVNVSATAPILDTSDATLGTTFSANTIQNFPLNGLDFSALTLYVPGAVNTTGTSGTTSIERSTQFSDTPNQNGNRAQSNNYTLDGIDLNESFNNLISYSPAPEALQEVRVLTANSPADYGNVNGGGIVSVLKSGTNQFHGSAYGYVQDYKINANSWSNNHAKQAAVPALNGNPAVPAVPAIPINPFSQAQFGGTFGGPIKREKLFFFVDYLGARYHQGGTGQASVLTPAMRNGDFSALLAGSNPIQLYDPENNFAPYVGNMGVPILNPVAKYLIAHPELYPLPNATAQDGIASNNLQGPTRTYKANNQGDIKLEYDPHAADKITAFYAMSTAYDGSTALLKISFPGGSIFPTKLGGLNWVHIFSPSIVNSARIGFTRTQWSTGIPGDPSGLFGLTGNAKVGIPFGAQSYVGFSNQNINNFSSVGTPAQGGGLLDNTYSYIDNLSVQRGAHTLSMGVQAIRYQNDYPTSNNYGFLGQFNYRGAFTSNPNVTNGGGYAAADFLLDRVAEAAVTLGAINVGQRQWRAAGFVQDDYKVLPNLTLNFGVRYEYDEPWIEANNKTGNIDLTTGQFIYAGRVPTGAPAGSGVCKNRGCYQPNYRQIMPRLGFAYQLNDRLVVRGGYGATSFYEGNSSNQRLTSITPFIQAVDNRTLSPTATGGGTPRTVEQGFALTDPTSLSLSGSVNIYPQNIQPAYVQEWSLTTEYALTNTTSLQVGYLGEQGQHIEDYGNVNQYRVNNDPTTAPYAANPNFGSGGMLITESRAMMNFNALESTLRQRLNHGLEFTLNYTYSKAMTNSLGNYSLAVNGYSGAFQNYYDSSADYGPAGYDVTHNVSGIGVYALPVGHGQSYLSGVNRFVDEVIGGWKVAVAGVAYSGFPQSLTGPGNNSNGYGNSRPNQYRKLKIVHHTIDHWFGTDPSAIPCTTAGVDNGSCAFGTPASNTFGTSRNGAVRGPGFLNVDSSAFKDFHTFREQSVGFRFDAFNVFNIASYGSPDVSITDTNSTGTNFGNISNQGPQSYQGQGQVRSTERRLQFSARYSF